MKILISGGHLTPALALIDYIGLHHSVDKVVFVGRIYSQSNLKQLAQEKKEVELRNIKFISLKAVKVSKTNSLIQRLLAPIFFIQSIINSIKILKKEKPAIFVSFGGFLAVPLSFAAKLTRTPILTHEQTNAAGFANQIIATLADRVAISHSSSTKFFPAAKTSLTGNPIRSKLTQKSTLQPSWISSKIKKPILLVIGGNQGSYIINQVVKQALSELTKNWTIIHLCGNSLSKLDYLEDLRQAREALPLAGQQNYYIKKWVNEQELSWIYDHTQAAISRAGANSVMELTYKNIPSIFIPLAHSHHDEQLKNAHSLVQKQAALLLPQDKLNPQNLLNELDKLDKNKAQLISQLKQISIPVNAAEKLYKLMTQLTTHVA